MAAYPGYTQLIGSTMSGDEGTVVERAVSGRPRLRTMFSQTWNTFTVQHEMTLAEKDAYEAFYEANKFLALTFAWAGDSQSYEVRFAGRPTVTPIEGDQRWRVVAQLVEV